VAALLPRGRRRSPVLSAVLPLAALLVIFCAGYVVGQLDALSGARTLPDMLHQIGLGALAARLPVAVFGEAALPVQDRQRFADLWEAWDLATREFYQPERIDRQRMVYGAVRGMLEALDDPYTAFLDPAHGQIADSDLRGSFDGVGIQLDSRDGKLIVIAPLDGSPGEQAGLLPGDVITQIDGTDVQGMPLSRAVLLIRGPRGTSVTLTIERENLSAPLTLTIPREEIKVDSVRSRMLEYVETDAALRALLDQHPRGIVLDLRSNPGGYVSAAVDVASEFLDHGVILYQQPANGERQVTLARPGGLATTIPLVVLVNHGSASASEIVAAALRDNGRALLIGDRTFGKGTVQTLHELSDHATVRITMAQWLTPNGEPIHGVGLEPDIAVSQPASLPAGEDPQLSVAVARLANAR
jgi:carboxyl-terminal processing protease